MPGLPPSGRKKRGKRPSDREEKLDLTVILNLMVILIPALLSQQVVDYYRHDVEFPTKGGAAAGGDAPQEAPKEQLNLRLVLNSDQSVILGNTRVVGTDGELAIPPAPDGQPDYAEVRRALGEEKDNRPPGNYADPDQITIIAPQSAPYQDVVKLLDAVRFHPTREIEGVPADLYSVVTLSPGRVG